MHHVAAKTVSLTTTEPATHEILESRIDAIAIESGLLPRLRDVNDTSPRMISPAEFVRCMRHYLSMN